MRIVIVTVTSHFIELHAESVFFEHIFSRPRSLRGNIAVVCSNPYRDRYLSARLTNKGLGRLKKRARMDCCGSVILGFNQAQIESVHAPRRMSKEINTLFVYTILQ